MAAPSDHLHDDIKTFLDSYIDRWNVYDHAAMQAMWDAEEAEPIYVAEEIDPVIGWPALEKYWRGGNPEISEHYIKWWGLKVKEAAPSVALAFYFMSWNIYFRKERLYPKPIGGEVRVSALLRKKPEGWRLFHYIEAPLAPMIYMKRTLEKAVQPELFAQLERKGIKP